MCCVREPSALGLHFEWLLFISSLDSAVAETVVALVWVQNIAGVICLLICCWISLPNSGYSRNAIHLWRK